jgi:hypothetical protein
VRYARIVPRALETIRSRQIVTTTKRVGIIGGVRIPFCRNNTAYADIGNFGMSVKVLGALVERFGLHGLELGEVAFGAVIRHAFDWNLAREATLSSGLAPTTPGITSTRACGSSLDNSINIGIISYVPTGIEVTDPAYDQYPTAIAIHDNTLTGTSDMPTGQLGALLISAIGEIQPSPPYIVPDIAWDGVLDPMRTYGPEDKICIQNNGDADFINLAWPLFETDLPSRDMAPHDCALAPLPSVTLP